MGTQKIKQSYTPQDKSAYFKLLFLFPKNGYAVDTQKNPLNETVLLNTQTYV